MRVIEKIRKAETLEELWDAIDGDKWRKPTSADGIIFNEVVKRIEWINCNPKPKPRPVKRGPYKTRKVKENGQRRV